MPATDLRSLFDRLVSSGIKTIVNVDPALPETVQEATREAAGGSVAVPGKAPCPCGSGKKYKRCCKPKDQPSFGGRPKLSQLLIDFARPLIDTMPDPDDAKILDRVLTVAVAGWNAAEDPSILDRINLNFAADDEMQSLISDIRPVLEMLIERRKRLFSQYDCFLGPVQVIDEGGRNRVVATGMWAGQPKPV